MIRFYEQDEWFIPNSIDLSHFIASVGNTDTLLIKIN